MGPRKLAGRRAEASPGFDFTLHMRRLCVDLAARLPELSHVDMARVAIRFCQTRRATRYGVHASLTPLGFEGGRLESRRRGRTWTVERLYDDAGREMLYLLSFYLPRFLDRPFHEKLTTVVHELWHIGPAFDGDLRRHPGRCYAHSHSQKQYDALVAGLAEKWLSLSPPAQAHDFLHCDFNGLQARHGAIFGQRIRTPKLLRAG
jgi:predicted metallopeptidase